MGPPVKVPPPSRSARTFTSPLVSISTKVGLSIFPTITVSERLISSFTGSVLISTPPMLTKGKNQSFIFMSGSLILNAGNPIVTLPLGCNFSSVGCTLTVLFRLSVVTASVEPFTGMSSSPISFRNLLRQKEPIASTGWMVGQWHGHIPNELFFYQSLHYRGGPRGLNPPARGEFNRQFSPTLFLTFSLQRFQPLKLIGLVLN